MSTAIGARRASSTARPRRTNQAARRTSSFEALGVVLRQDGDHATDARGLEVHDARAARVDRVVPAEAGALAGAEAGPALAHDYLAAGDDLAREQLHAEALGVRVAAVAAGTKSLFMSHYLALIESMVMRVSSERCPAVRL